MSDLNEQLRAAFEEWAIGPDGPWTKLGMRRCADGTYRNEQVQDQWDCWQAARRAPAAAPAPVAAIPKQWESQLRLCPSTEDVIAAMKAEITAWRALAAVPAAAPIVQPVGEKLNTESSRLFLIEFMEQHFTDKTYHRYIRGDGRNALAGDFAYQMANAVRAALAASSTAEAKDAARLLAALRKYGTHLHTCECVDGGEIDPSLEEYCNCGLNELLEGRVAITSSADEVKP